MAICADQFSKYVNAGGRSKVEPTDSSVVGLYLYRPDGQQVPAAWVALTEVDPGSEIADRTITIANQRYGYSKFQRSSELR